MNSTICIGNLRENMAIKIQNQRRDICTKNEWWPWWICDRLNRYIIQNGINLIKNLIDRDRRRLQNYVVIQTPRTLSISTKHRVTKNEIREIFRVNRFLNGFMKHQNYVFYPI